MLASVRYGLDDGGGGDGLSGGGGAAAPSFAPSTAAEMGLLLSARREVFLIKLTKSPLDDWDARATAAFSAARAGDAWEHWAPGAPMPPGLAGRVEAKLEAARVMAGLAAL